jgi:hypothetical protein
MTRDDLIHPRSSPCDTPPLRRKSYSMARLVTRGKAGCASGHGRHRHKAREVHRLFEASPISSYHLGILRRCCALIQIRGRIGTFPYLILSRLPEAGVECTAQIPLGLDQASFSQPLDPAFVKLVPEVSFVARIGPSEPPADSAAREPSKSSEPLPEGTLC